MKMFHSVHFPVKYGKGCVSFLILIKLITNKRFWKKLNGKSQAYNADWNKKL